MGPTLAEQVANTTDREDRLRAAFMLCEEMEPETIDPLVEKVCPKGIVSMSVFDSIADAYELWRSGQEIENGVKTVQKAA